MQAKTLDALQVFDRQQGCGLRVDFFRTGTTYGHRIVGVGAEGAIATLLESVGGEFDPCPASPVLQELNTHDQAAMLVGNAGAGHWSLAIGPLAGDSATGLLLDVACRVNSLPPILTSTYRVSEGVLANFTDRVLKLGTPAGECQIEAVAVGASQGPCQLRLTGRLLEFRLKPTGPAPATFRWQYTMRLLG